MLNTGFCVNISNDFDHICVKNWSMGTPQFKSGQVLKKGFGNPGFDFQGKNPKNVLFSTFVKLKF